MYVLAGSLSIFRISLPLRVRMRKRRSNTKMERERSTHYRQGGMSCWRCSPWIQHDQYVRPHGCPHGGRTALFSFPCNLQEPLRVPGSFSLSRVDSALLNADVSLSSSFHPLQPMLTKQPPLLPLSTSRTPLLCFIVIPNLHLSWVSPSSIF